MRMITNFKPSGLTRSGSCLNKTVLLPGNDIAKLIGI